MTSATTRPYREFGSWLRSRRLARRMTQEELARKLDYGVTYVRKIEWGERRPSDGFRVRLAQVLAVPVSTLPASLPPAAGRGVPEAPTPLVGRDEELSAVLQLFERGARLVTLLGPPGIGKTRLALAVASDLDAALPGGALFVPLADVAGPAGVPAAIWKVVGGTALVDDDGRDPAELAERLRSQGTLLVLDNFEHVVVAAPLVGELLARVPGLRVLVTSREALDLASETRYVVGPLAVPAGGGGDLAQLADVPAVALFLARARKVRPEFALDAANAAAVAAVCTRLQGIPLALELAAGATRFLAPRDLLEQLGPGLDLPVPGPRDAPGHHRTLRAAIGWSFELLHPAEHLLMTRLAVFAGGCTLDAVAAVCRLPGEDHLDPRDALLSLVAKSLVEPVPMDPGGTRFVALEAVRAFAAEALQASGQLEILRGRHSSWCVELVEAIEPRLAGPAQGEALAVFEAEHANLRTAIGWSVEHDPRTAVRLCAGMWRFWWMRGHLGEGRQWLDAALAGSPEEDAARAMALTGAGVLARTEGAYEPAVILLERGADLARALGDRRALALAAINLGIVAELQGDHVRSWSMFEESRALSAAIGDLRGLGHSLNCLGNVRLGAGDLDESAGLFEQALSAFRELRDDWSAAMALANLGWIADKQGRRELARMLYEKGLAMFRVLGDDRAAANVLLNLGTTTHASGDVVLAEGLFREALLSLDRLGERRGVAECLEALARARTSSDSSGAAVLLGAADSLRQRIGAPLSPDEQVLRNGTAAALRAALGETRFDVAWERGRLLSEDEVVAEALAKG